MEALERWQYLKTADAVEHRFVVMLSPVLEYLYQAILKHIQTLPVVSVLFDEFDLLAWLRQDLCHLFSPMLSRSCAVEIYYAKEAGQLQGETPEERFQSFIELLETPEFVTGFMQKYHVLQGIIDRRATHYLNALCDFFNHLNHDYIAVSKQLFSTTDPLKLSRLTSEGADVHCQGKRVFILHFLDSNKNVQRLVYKPHQLDPEQAFNHMIEWLNPWISESALLPMKLVNYEDHGWVEFIEHKSCVNEDGIKHFYRRSGHLLALLYMFNGLDIHFENIIAHGAYPVLVDLECLLTPIQSLEETKRFSLPTVLNCMLLPNKIGNDKQKNGIDMSALGFMGGEHWFNKRFSWKNPGTDEMKFARVESKSTPSLNQPYIKKIGDVDYLNYEEEILQGFEKAYFILLNNSSDFLKKFTDELSQIHLRLIIRPTAQYYQLLVESYHPSLLRNPSAYQEHMDWLNERLETYPQDEPLIAAEYMDLNSGDIPFFSSKADSLEVFNSYGQKTGYTTQQSGWELFQFRMLNIFSAADCEKQKYLIRMSFVLAKINNELISPPPVGKNVQRLDQEVTENFSQQFIFFAEALLDELSHLLLVANNKLAWPDIDLDTHAKYPILNPGLTNTGLYSGNLGILLTFLYGYQQIKKASYQNIISQCLASLTADILSDDVDHWGKDISAFGGYAGVLYVLCLAEKLGFISNVLLQDKVLQKIEQHLKEDTVYDVIGGAAGTLLVLVKIYTENKSTRVHAIISELIQHLLQAYPDPTLLPKSLKENYFFPSPGFSHGISGIAFALWQARFVFSNQQTETWIEKALIYIKQLYDQYGYIPDARSLKKNKKSAAASPQRSPLWCHGHVGIGLFYLELHRQNSPLAIHAPLSIIINEINDLDHKLSEGNLCCGSLGELELLYQLTQFTQTEEAHTLFTKEVNRLLYNLDQKNYFLYTKGGGFSTNLMQGKAGIAYMLLRLNAPQRVNSVLLLQ